MSNSDVMSGFGLWVYPTVGMVIFLIVFVVAMVRVLGRDRREEIVRGGNLPLADDTFEPELRGGGDRVPAQSPAVAHRTRREEVHS